QRIAHRRIDVVDRPPRGIRDDGVVGTLAAERAIGQLGREARVGGRQSGGPQLPRQQQAGVGAGLMDGADGLGGDGARGVHADAPGAADAADAAGAADPADAPGAADAADAADPADAPGAADAADPAGASDAAGAASVRPDAGGPSPRAPDASVSTRGSSVRSP